MKLLSALLEGQEKKKIIEISDKAKCIYIEGILNKEKKPLPLIIKKNIQLRL